MSIQAVAWALEQDLPARPKLVLVSIANHASHVDGYCWLKAATIAAEAACTPRSVYTFIGGLVRNGFIRKELRRGGDGKQRANDYWILFTREEKAWDWGAHPEADVAEGDGDDGASSEAEDTISGGPSEPASPGETPEPHERHDTRQPVDIPVPSPGPSEAAFTRKSIAEPSESKPKESSAGARAMAPRAYRQPPPTPPQPMGAIADHEAKQIFVYEGTRAYDAWAKRMGHQNGIRNWHLVTNKVVDGKWMSGWYFPSLFPPDDHKATDPPSNLSDEEVKEFLKSA